MKKTKRSYHKQTWDEWLSCAESYYKEHGDLLIPAKYATADGYRLGRWIERQRAMYNQVSASSLSSEQKHALEQIGMVWKLEERLHWNQWLSMAQDYHLAYGNLNIPSSYITSNGYRLGFWLKEQRKKQKAGLLTQQQMDDLNRLDMVWTQVERHEWDSWYTLAAAYFCEHGHLLVPFDYKNTDGHKLGQWIHVQRERYKGKRKPLSAAQVKALEKISMVWSLSDTRTEKWDSMYQWVADYRSNNGKLPLRPSLLAPDGRSMGNWISVQRTALSQGKLSKDKAERLKLLEIFPFGYQK